MRIATLLVLVLAAFFGFAVAQQAEYEDPWTTKYWNTDSLAPTFYEANFTTVDQYWRNIAGDVGSAGILVPTFFFSALLAVLL